MEQLQTSNIYHSLEMSRLSDASFSNQRNILKDNYSLEEIVELKIRDLAKTVHNLSDLFERESTIPSERTCIEFATFLKEKNNYISSLHNVLRETEPFGFPKYRIEGYIKVKETLEAVVQDLKVSRRSIQERKNELNSRTKRSEDVCKILQDVMDKTVDEKNTADVTNAISLKLAEEKMQKSKEDLKYVLETVFPANKHMKTILAALVEANEQSDIKKRWVPVTKEMDHSCVLHLIQAGIIKKHPEDKTKIALVTYGR